MINGRAELPPVPEKNQAYVKPGPNQYNTQLPSEMEAGFRQWLQSNSVPFDPDAAVSDYDMRGFYQALKSGDLRALSSINLNDNQLHYPDYWKTPYHKSFSNESQWAKPDAPKWNDVDQLVDSKGNVVFDERVHMRRPAGLLKP